MNGLSGLLQTPQSMWFSRQKRHNDAADAWVLSLYHHIWKNWTFQAHRTASKMIKFLFFHYLVFVNAQFEELVYNEKISSWIQKISFTSQKTKIIVNCGGKKSIGTASNSVLYSSEDSCNYPYWMLEENPSITSAIYNFSLLKFGFVAIIYLDLPFVGRLYKL